jgi:hypothetical protein
MTRDGVSGLQISLLCETHSSGATRKEQSLLTAPVWPVVVKTVVSDLEPSSPVGFDCPNLTIACCGVVDIGYLLT